MEEKKEKKYLITDNETKEILATDMPLDIALILIKGYISEYYRMPVNLTIISHTIETEEIK